MKPFEISNRHFIPLFFLYSGISWIAMQMSSGGWVALSNQVIGGLFFAACWILVLILSLLNRRRSGVLIDMDLLCLTLLLQSAHLLFNIGDCGDNEGQYTFIETIFVDSRQAFCTREGSRFSTSWVLLLPLAYFVLVLFTIVKGYSKTNISRHSA